MTNFEGFRECQWCKLGRIPACMSSPFWGPFKFILGATYWILIIEYTATGSQEFMWSFQITTIVMLTSLSIPHGIHSKVRSCYWLKLCHSNLSSFLFFMVTKNCNWCLKPQPATGKTWTIMRSYLLSIFWVKLCRASQSPGLEIMKKWWTCRIDKMAHLISEWHSCFIILSPIIVQKSKLLVPQTKETGFFNFGCSRSWNNHNCLVSCSSLVDWCWLKNLIFTHWSGKHASSIS